MFSSVTTACRGKTRFRWNSGETFQQETHRRHQKPKALLLISSSREKLPLLELHGLKTSRSTFVMLYLRIETSVSLIVPYRVLLFYNSIYIACLFNRTCASRWLSLDRPQSPLFPALFRFGTSNSGLSSEEKQQKPNF